MPYKDPEKEKERQRKKYAKEKERMATDPEYAEHRRKLARDWMRNKRATRLPVYAEKVRVPKIVPAMLFPANKERKKRYDEALRATPEYKAYMSDYMKKYNAQPPRSTQCVF